MDVSNVTLRKYDRYTGNSETVAWEKKLLCEINVTTVNYRRMKI